MEEYKILFLIHIFTLLAYTIDVSWYFIGKEQIKSITTRNIIVRLTSLILIFTFVKEVDDLNNYIMINAITFLWSINYVGTILKEITFTRILLRRY